MKNILLVLCILLFPVSVTVGQEPVRDSEISPAKHALIAEIIAVTKADEQIEKIMRAMFDQVDESYPKLVEGIVDSSYPDLSASQRAKIVSIAVKRNSSEQGLRTRLINGIDFKDFTEKTMFPLYGKFFTENELTDMLTFYKSPTGQKLNRVLPELYQESVRLSQEVLLPQIVNICKQVAEEEVAKAKKDVAAAPAPKKKG